MEWASAVVVFGLLGILIWGFVSGFNNGTKV